MEMKMKIKESLRQMVNETIVTSGYQTDEYLFTIQCANYFYFGNNIGSQDIKSGFVDGANDGGIDFVLTSDDDLYLLQGKSSANIDVNDVLDIFTKMARTLKDYHDGDFNNYNNRLKSVLSNTIDSLPEKYNTYMVLFTNAKMDGRKRGLIDKKILASEDLGSFTLEIYDVDDIDDQASSIEGGPSFVTDESLRMDSANNVLRYDKNGLIVNVMASSLKRIYEKHHMNGLFSYNLREHFKQKDVDDAIDNTIKSSPNKFWYLNNGITIACEEFYVDGNTVKVSNFSIINGAQTTTKISTNESVSTNNDFPVVCKIVQTGKLNQNHEFMSEISEASNSQKPIRIQDLKSNKKEQRKLHQDAKSHSKPLLISIKRGVKIKHSGKNIKAWQRIDNTKLAQIMAAAILQIPGTARSAKKSLFDNKELYKKIFLRKHDFDTLYDLVRFADYYDLYLSNEKLQLNNTSNEDLDRESVRNNCKFVTLGILAYIIKRERNIIKGRQSKELTEDNLKGTLIQTYLGDDFEELLFDLFTRINHQLAISYSKNQTKLGLTSHSNYFKSDSYYRENILADIEQYFYLDKFAADYTDKLFKIFDE